MIMGILTAILIVLYFGIVGWAYSRRRADDFAEAARLPLRDDDSAGGSHA